VSSLRGWIYGGVVVRCRGLRRAVVCGGFALILGGCGGALYAMRAGKVSSELELAERAGAAESAPYEFFYADEHLRKSRSEAAESDFGDALSLLATAEEYTRLARDGTRAPVNAAPVVSTSSRRVPSEIARLDQLALAAEQGGARRCAPRELAVGRSQLEFAAIEDAQGGAAEAGEHLKLAELNVQAARLLSSAQGCGANRPLTGARSPAPGER
jgi:hypothetical protein